MSPNRNNPIEKNRGSREIPKNRSSKTGQRFVLLCFLYEKLGAIEAVKPGQKEPGRVKPYPAIKQGDLPNQN